MHAEGLGRVIRFVRDGTGRMHFVHPRIFLPVELNMIKLSKAFLSKTPAPHPRELSVGANVA